MSEASRIVELRGALIANRAQEIRDELNSCLRRGERVVLDLSEVTAIDVVGLQLLLSARASHETRSQELEFQSASASVIAFCEALGLSFPQSARD